MLDCAEEESGKRKREDGDDMAALEAAVTGTRLQGFVSGGTVQPDKRTQDEAAAAAGLGAHCADFFRVLYSHEGISLACWIVQWHMLLCKLTSILEAFLQLHTVRMCIPVDCPQVLALSGDGLLMPVDAGKCDLCCGDCHGLLRYPS